MIITENVSWRRNVNTLLKSCMRGEFWKKSGPILGLLVLLGLFQTASGGIFLSADMMGATSAFISGLGVVAIGVTMLMICGEYDLSVSQSFVLPAIVMGALITRFDFSVALALGIALVVALVIGLTNGIITVYLKVDSFIVTLAMLLILTSLTLTIATTNPPNILGISSPILVALGGGVLGSSVKAPFIWLLLIAVVLTIVLSASRFGNWTRAAGVRRGHAALAMGVPVRLVKVCNFCLCSTLSGFAGIALVANIGVARNDLGQNLNLLAIVAAVIGGASLFGGRGSVLGAVVGAFVLGVLSSGLIVTGIDQQFYIGVVGAVLLVAAYINIRLSGREKGG